MKSGGTSVWTIHQEKLERAGPELKLMCQIERSGQNHQDRGIQRVEVKAGFLISQQGEFHGREPKFVTNGFGSDGDDESVFATFGDT